MSAHGEGLRVAMLSVHTSPLAQPGTGDAGGMNVYVTGLADALARMGASVEIFTRATASSQPEAVEMADGVLVRHVTAGPFEGLDKNDLPGQLCAFTAGVLRTEASRRAGWYDVVHSHYWLSGQAGWLAADRWDVPLVHSMHTMAKVKNAALAPGDTPEPRGRVIGEEQVVIAADGLVASTAQEAHELVDLYDAAPDRVHVVPPGVDLDIFAPRAGGAERDGVSGLVPESSVSRALAEPGAVPTPGSAADALATQGEPVSDAERRAERRALGLPDGPLVLFAGRVQLLKGPDVLVEAMSVLRARAVERGTLAALPTLVILGGPSGRPTAVRELEALAHRLGVTEHVLFRPPVPREELARWFRAADVVAVPSHTESFGLVAVEAQACGTPVVAAAVGGLRTVVHDDVSGVLVDGHDPRRWAGELERLLADPARRARLAEGALAVGRSYGWDAAAASMLDVYDLAAKVRRERG